MPTITDARGNQHQAAGAPASQGGQFAAKRSGAQHGALTLDDADGARLSGMEPADIDQELAELEGRIWLATDQIAQTREKRRKYQANRDRFADGDPAAARWVKLVGDLDATIEEQEAARDELIAQRKPYTTEFHRRGGWTRAFYVPGGDVHKSTSCPQCNKGSRPTRFAWLTEYSGQTEDEIIDVAGSTACTVCYPDAPVDVRNRPRKFLTQTEIEQAEAKAAKEAARAQKEAEKTAKAITSPDGSPLRGSGGLFRADTLVTAERELVDALHTLKMHESKLMEIGNPDFLSDVESWRDKLVEAIAHKKGQTADDALAEYEAKAEKKFQKTHRDWSSKGWA